VDVLGKEKVRGEKEEGRFLLALKFSKFMKLISLNKTMTNSK
jgi:hypothetical protein